MKHDAPGTDARWKFWVDRGGTFTDIVAVRPDGALVTHKLLSEHPARYRDAVVEGMRDLLGVAQDEALPHERIEVVKMGTTVATNALLERKGARTLLAITRGFGDQLRIGYQDRPDIFARHICLPSLMYERVAEIDERIGAHGELLSPLDEAGTRAQLAAAHADGIDSIAIVLMHAYRSPAHELRVAEIAAETGFKQISVSHEVSPLMKLVGRGDTTVVDAYLSPVLRDYVNRVAAHTGPVPLHFMQSNGGLVEAGRFQGKDAILSGPAGGIVGAVKSCESAGERKLIGFDMGGTSTDVAHYDGAYERVFETQVAGVRVRAPMMDIHTVAAGGGSICVFENGRMRVGPESAGAHPGPACYRNGGPLTVTDCNLLLGRVQADHFPHVFGPQGNLPLDADIVRQKFEAMAARVREETGHLMAIETIAEGFLAIAVDNMAQAIKVISVERGHDVTDYSICAFGGAGGQHACAVADSLGVRRILLHPLAGVLSAFGMGLADLRTMRERAVEADLDVDNVQALHAGFAKIEQRAIDEILGQHVGRERIRSLRTARLKYRNTDSTLEVAWSDAATMTDAFNALHRKRYGFVMAGKPLMIESIAVEAIGETTQSARVEIASHGAQDAQGNALIAGSDREARLFIDGRFHDVLLRPRASLRAGRAVTGPALITESISTIVVLPGWQAVLLEDGTLRLDRLDVRERDGDDNSRRISTERHPVHLEIFNNLFMAIAQQMGTTLEKTSHSVNMKERLDFSCAIFDRDANLIANAPHIPVHLGSMGDSVASVAAKHGATLAPGDVFMLNLPYNGGTHLPDITVVMPVFDRAGDELLFYVAARGHHGDIGGITPGSMPPNSTSILEEGVLIDNIKIVSAGEFLDAAVRALFSSGHYPSRNVDQNIADLAAQIAACECGAKELLRVADRYGEDVVLAYMGYVQDNAEEAVRNAIATLRDGVFSYEMDDGATIDVKLTVDHSARTVKIDFSGTSEQRPSNFNAPRSICKAAVLYVFRTLLDSSIPMNDGVLRPVQLIIPQGSMLHPVFPAAVVAGNVEVSQAITDALYGAMGVLAAAQGTMNNFTFGDATHQYYETIAGGSGAGATHPGTSAVQTHMTNSRMTDPEVLEWRFPVVVEQHAIRASSGGAGQHKGGDGAVRRIRFTQPMTANMLANRRRVAPFGLSGGAAGAVGRNWVERANGAVERFGATHTTDMQAGDVFVIETPGGGGFGAP